MFPIRIEPYDPQWTAHFQRISSMLHRQLPALIAEVHHVGSTAVPGLAAKPIIDVDIILNDFAQLPFAVEALKRSNYQYLGELGIPGRHAFSASPGIRLPAHHLYVCDKESEGYKNHIALRDYLRGDTMARDEYAQLKQRLVERYPEDLNAYVEGKTQFITGILARAGFSGVSLELIKKQNTFSGTAVAGLPPESPSTDRFEIRRADRSDYRDLLQIWEASVRATHDFLSEADIRQYRSEIYDYYFDQLIIYRADYSENLAGFIGIQDDYIQMLFVSPDYFGKGIGKRLVGFATEQHAAKRVDVNEQNTGAVQFYKKLGFKITGRSTIDPSGNPFPILFMALAETGD